MTLELFSVQGESHRGLGRCHGTGRWAGGHGEGSGFQLEEPASAEGQFLFRVGKNTALSGYARGEFSQTPEGHGYFGEGMSYEVNFTPKQFLKTGQIYVGGGVSMSSTPIRDDHLKANSVV